MNFHMIEIEILTSPGCHSCDRAKTMISELVQRLSKDFPDLSWKTTDLTENPELITKYGIMSTPAIAFNGRLEFRGVPKEKQLIEKIQRYASHVQG